MFLAGISPFALRLAAVALVAATAAFSGGCADKKATARTCLNDTECAGTGVNPFCDPQTRTCGARGQCSDDEQCRTWNPGFTNAVCNRAAGICIDRGACRSDADCPGGACDTRTGRCTPGGDGDVSDTSDNGDEASENDIPPPDDDGDDTSETGDDLPEADEELPPQCPNVGGAFDVNATCGTEVIQGLVFVSQELCSIAVRLPDGTKWLGTIDAGGTIRTTEGKVCTGRVDGGGLSFTCEGCTITGDPQPGEGSLRVSPDEIDFGSVLVGDSRTQDITIENTGTTPVRLVEVALSPQTNPDFSLTLPTVAAFPYDIPPGSRVIAQVTVAPTTNQSKTGAVNILNSTARASIVVNLKSAPKGVSCLTIDPPVIRMGSVPTGGTNRGLGVFLNPCEANAFITNIRVIDDGQGAIDLDPAALPSLPYTLGAGGRRQFALTCSPIQGVHTDGQVITGRFEVTTEDSTGATDTITGEGTCTVVAPAPPCINIQPREIFDASGTGNGFPGIAFGATPVGNTGTRPLTITNCGDQPLVVSQISGFAPSFFNPLQQGCFNLSNPFAPPIDPFCEFRFTPGIPLTNIVIPRGQDYVIDVGFVPSRVGAPQGYTIAVASNAATVNPPVPPGFGGQPQDPANLRVDFLGQGATNAINVLPQKLEFGLITVNCCSRWETVTIYNTGDLALEVREVRIGQGSDPRFEIDTQGVTYPFTVAGGQTLAFRARFCAVREGAANARIEIVSNAVNQQNYIVPMTGEGTLLTFQRDEFSQPTEPKVDVLWVIDNSGSMGEEQSNISRNFGAFTSEAARWRADWQTGVATTDLDDPNQAGKLQGNPRVMNFRAGTTSSFPRTAIVGTQGSGTEQGLEASRLALTAPLITDPQFNGGFLRADAALAVIYVSDEEDQSNSAWDFYRDFLKNIKGFRNTELLRVYAIVGDPRNGCSSSDGDAAAGDRYVNVAQACGGFWRSICQPDFTPVFRDIGSSAFGLRRQFFLSRLPDPRTIAVTVNGTRQSAPGDYSYDDPSNAVVFTNPPAPGATIVVEYETICLR